MDEKELSEATKDIEMGVRSGIFGMLLWPIVLPLALLGMIASLFKKKP